MQNLYKNASQQSVMEDMGLKPLVENELTANGITSLHVHTFTNMSKQYTSLNDYRNQIQQEMKAKDEEF